MPGSHYDHRPEREILIQIEKKVDKLMTAVEDLTAAVTALEADETGAATAFTALAAEIAKLEAGQISEATIEELAVKAAAVGTALSAATAGA
jgi:hypothetical protein